MNDSTDLETMGYVIATTSLERNPKRAIRPQVRPNRTVHRQFERDIRPIGHFDEEGDMDTLAKKIVRRIRTNRHATNAGSYLMGDEQGDVYVVAEGSSTGLGFINRHEGWHIGRYGAGLRGALPMIDQVIGDLQEHFKGRFPAEVAA